MFIIDLIGIKLNGKKFGGKNYAHEKFDSQKKQLKS